jgi:hypothetical protein
MVEHRQAPAVAERAFLTIAGDAEDALVALVDDLAVGGGDGQLDRVGEVAGADRVIGGQAASSANYGASPALAGTSIERH